MHLETCAPSSIHPNIHSYIRYLFTPRNSHKLISQKSECRKLSYQSRLLYTLVVCLIEAASSSASPFHPYQRTNILYRCTALA